MQSLPTQIILPQLDNLRGNLRTFTLHPAYLFAHRAGSDSGGASETVCLDGASRHILPFLSCSWYLIC